VRDLAKSPTEVVETREKAVESESHGQRIIISKPFTK